MNVLLADSNRDFLLCYQKLLAMDGYTVTTAFDGAQAMVLLKQHPFDIVLLEETLPRMELTQLLQTLAAEGIPVIVMANRNVTVKTLLQYRQPNAYLSFPFLPADLTGLIRAVLDKKRSDETLPCGDIGVDLAGFCFSGTETPLTNGEIDLLRELKASGKTMGKRKRVMIQALNEKMKKLGLKTRIIYEMEKGYRLVNQND